MTRARDLANLIGSGNFTTETLTATAGQTAFTPSNTFTSNFLQVFYNGLLLDPTVDYTENGTTITLTVAATAGDEMEVVTYNTFSVGDAITQTEADNRYVNASGDTIPNGLEIRSDTLSTAPIVASNGFDGDQFQIKQPNRGGHFGWQCSGTSSENYVVIDRQRSNEVLSIHGTQNHILRTNNTDRLTIDSSGRVTMPYQPAFQSHSTVGFVTTSGGNVIPFSGSTVNRGNHYNTSTSTFTAPVGGVYQFDVSFYAENNQLSAAIAVNGSAVSGSDVIGYAFQASGEAPRTISTSLIRALSANDTVNVIARSGYSAYYYGGHSYFSGYLIG